MPVKQAAKKATGKPKAKATAKKGSAPSPAKPRTLRQRDSDVRVDRLLAGPRLKGFDRTALANRTTKDGVRMKDYVKTALRSKKDGDRLGDTFWKGFFWDCDTLSSLNHCLSALLMALARTNWWMH